MPTWVLATFGWLFNARAALTCPGIFRPSEIRDNGSLTARSSDKKTRFTDEQIVRILQEADRDPIAAVAKRHGVSEASIYIWRKRFGDMGTDDVKRLRNLEQENSRLKKILAERDLEIEVMKEITAKKW
jgi:putative transposase